MNISDRGKIIAQATDQTENEINKIDEKDETDETDDKEMVEDKQIQNLQRAGSYNLVAEEPAFPMLRQLSQNDDEGYSDHSDIDDFDDVLSDLPEDERPILLSPKDTKWLQNCPYVWGHTYGSPNNNKKASIYVYQSPDEDVVEDVVQDICLNISLLPDDFEVLYLVKPPVLIPL